MNDKKQILKYSLLLILILIIVISIYQVTKAEKKFTYYSNGNLKTEETYKNDKRDGLWKGYDEDGNLEYQRSYKKGQKEGLWKFYFDNGNLEAEINYRNGEQEGLWKKYHKNGNVKEEKNYKKGERKLLLSDGLIKKSLSHLKTDAVVAIESDNTTLDICNYKTLDKYIDNSANEYPKTECIQSGPTGSKHAVKWAIVVELKADANGGGKNYYCIDGYGKARLKISTSITLTSVTADGDIGDGTTADFFVSDYSCQN